jgi:hypothetical protein
LSEQECFARRLSSNKNQPTEKQYAENHIGAVSLAEWKLSRNTLDSVRSVAERHRIRRLRAAAGSFNQSTAEPFGRVGVVLQGGPSLNPLADAEAGAGRELNESHSGAIDLIAVVVVRERLREDILAGGKKTTALGFTCRLSSS